MKVRISFFIALCSIAVVSAFAPIRTSKNHRRWESTTLRSAIEKERLTAEVYNRRLESQLEKLKARDASSTPMSKEDLKVVFVDEHIIVVNKPAGVLTVPGKENNPSLSQAVFDAYGCESGRADKMVVHRLGMDTSGLVVFARTENALRGMNALFRTRKIIRKYEALLCGTIESEEGNINMPLMRDYESPPYMRISTEEHQRALIGLSAEDVGKKILENPKDSLTKYKVVGREDYNGYAVSRVQLTSISGRTHQLNVHCAAFGHPIVGDKIYGINGEAAPNGGLDQGTSPTFASQDQQQKIAAVADGKSMCVHAKILSFEHPVSNEKLSFECDSPF